MTKEKLTRYPLIDLIRLTAIILMVFFHLFYDLDKFGFVDINFRQDPFWNNLPRLIVFLFMLCVGMGLALSHEKEIRWPKVGKRFVKVGLFALIISLYTYFAFPKTWIYFGTLHCIALSSVLALPFLRYPKLALTVGLGMALAYGGLSLRLPSLSRQLGIVSMDYIPPHPWLGIVLIGLFLHSCHFHQWKSHWRLPRWMTWASRYSLEIYMTHQIILYGLIFGLHQVLRS